MGIVTIFPARQRNDRADQTFYRATVQLPKGKVTSNCRFASQKGAAEWAAFIIAKQPVDVLLACYDVPSRDLPKRSLREAMCSMGPDSDPTYKESGDGKWSVQGRIYPVARPPRGKIVILNNLCENCKDMGERVHATCTDDYGTLYCDDCRAQHEKDGGTAFAGSMA